MASPYTAVSTLNATLFKGDDAAYSTTHNAADADVEETSQTSLYFGQNALFGGLYYIRRGVCKFTVDLGADAAGATITSVVLHLWPNTVQDDSSGDSISVVSFTPASDTDPTVADYDQLGTTIYAPSKLITAFTASADNTFTFNATGIAAVQAVLSSPKTLWLGLRCLGDINNTTPTHNGQVIGDGRSGTNPPYLVITYTVSSTARSHLLLMGVA